jgi:hypothetical protein
MQVKKIALAVAFAIAAPVALANLETTPETVTSDNIINVTGATAPTKTIGIALEDICATASTAPANRLFITITDGTAAPVGKGWKCQVPAGTTFTKLPGVSGPWIVRKNEGGSLNGIAPLRNGTTAGTAQTQLNTTSATCTSSIVVNPLNARQATATCPIGAGQRTHIGISDVSQRVFAAKNQLSGANAITGANTYVADQALGQIQGFGLAVSPALYALLQADQGVGTGIPSISKNQYATITSTTDNPWPVLLPNSTEPAGSLTVARRSTTSGTQASAELFFLNNPCNAGAAPLGGSRNAILTNNANNLVITQAGSSDVVINTVANTSSTNLSIGVASLENIAPTAANTWKFVAIDGVHPGQPNSPEWQRKNIINGSYDFAFQTYLFRNTTSTGPTALSAALLNNIVDFSNGLINDLGVGANLNDSNGIAGDPNAGTADFGPETAKFTRGAAGECAPATYLN